MENEECISAMEVTRGISRPNIQCRIASPVDIVRYEMDSLTRATKKTFIEIVVNYHEETIISPTDAGEELGG